MMIEIKKIVSAEVKSKLQNDYIETLTIPIDGYWQNVKISSSECYEIMYNDKIAGHFCVDSRKTLIQFYVSKKYFIHAQEIFKYVITSDMVEKAAVSTKELEFMALCLDYQKSISIDSYLFIDNKKVKYELDNFRDVSFRLAKKGDIDSIKNKCDSAFEGYYEDLIGNDQLFVLYDGDNLLGIGEFRIIKTHGRKYGDIGMHVVEVYRRKGIGAYIITQLKEHCYGKNLIPMACCDVENIASKKTLEKSGFITNHRILYVNFN
jgi:predicted acetyltransferase